MTADAVLLCKSRQPLKDVVWEVLHGQLVRTEDEEAPDAGAAGNVIRKTVPCIGEENIIPGTASVDNHLLRMTDDRLLMRLDEVEGDDESFGSGLPVQLHIALQHEVHD